MKVSVLAPNGVFSMLLKRYAIVKRPKYCVRIKKLTFSPCQNCPLMFQNGRLY